MTEHVDLTGTRLGNYRLERILGRGRMGVVYLAHDEALLRPTAVKILSWAFLASHTDEPEAWLLAEARSVARINHPAVVQVYNIAKQGGYCYVAMEYVDGMSGDTLVAARGPFSATDATQVVLQVAGALDRAHACNIIHRDVKPANVLIKLDGTAKLGDFGMALQAECTSPGSPMPVGTPHYIAPELWQGASATPLTDIYALGATYFCFLTGRPPFNTGDLRTLINQHEHAEIPDPSAIIPTVPSHCTRIIQRCLAKSPRDRYQSAQELGWELRGVLRRLQIRPSAEVTTKSAEMVRAEEPSSDTPTLALATEPWAAGLGLARRPFAGVDPRRCPYQGEPLRGLRERLRTFVRNEPGGTLILTGARGSGRTILARQSIADVRAHVPTACLDLKYGAEPAGRTLLQWACRALGALPSASSGRDVDLNGLIEHLAVRAEPALLVLDAVPPRAPFAKELSSLVRAARSTRCLSLIVVGGSGLAEELAAAGGLDPEAMTTVMVPALDALRTWKYLTAWLDATRDPAAPPLVITPDAAMVVHHRSEGSLARINILATNMLRMAALEKRRVLPSWHAWIASAGEGWSPDGSIDLRKPPGWPPPNVLDVLATYRRQFGLPQRCEGSS